MMLLLVIIDNLLHARKQVDGIILKEIDVCNNMHVYENADSNIMINFIMKSQQQNDTV